MRGSDLIREARRRAGLTQSQLAGRAGTTQSAIARAESGRRRPAFDEILRLVRLCGLDLNVRLVPYDDSHVVQAEALRGLSPEARLQHLKHAVARLRTLRSTMHDPAL